MEIYLNNGHSFPVPVAVADHLLGLASHDQLKVLLYVLCHANEPLSQEQIAKSCKVQPAAVEEALVFWQDEVNILNITHAVPTVTIQNKTAVAQSTPNLTESAEPVQNTNPAVQIQSFSSPNLLPSEIAERLNKNKAMKNVFDSVANQIGNMPNNTIQNCLIRMNEYLGLEPDLILMLATFCVKIKSFNARYMEKIAIEWQERGITTHALAERDINRRDKSRTYTGRIMQLFEMSRTPTAYQQSFIDQWQTKGYSLDLIQFAYEKTRNQADDKLSFPYINTILLAWNEAGIRTVQEAQKLDEAFYQEKAQKKAKKTRPEKTKPAGSIQADTQDASFDLADFDQLVNRF